MALIVWLLSGWGAVADAEPTSAPEPQLAQLPAKLQKYVPDSAAWAASPWMTSETCRDKGGDFSLWASNVISDAADLMEFFDSDSAKPNADYWRQLRDNYRTMAAEIVPSVPAGYCVNEVKQWAGTNSEIKPFGFEWGMSHGSPYWCTWHADTNDHPADYVNRWVGAERAPCDGFYIRCDSATEQDWPRCDAWNSFSKGFVDRTEQARHDAAVKFPATGQGEVKTELKSPGEIVGDVALGWFSDITKAIATGAATLLAEAMTFWTRADHSSMLRSPAIGEIQGLLRWVGLVVLVGSVMWQGILMVFKRKPDPLVSAGMGLLSFVGWSTLGTTAAILLYEGGNALTSQILDESISKFAETMGMAMQANLVSSVAVIFFLSIIMFFLACIQWVLGFFRMGALVILLALLPTAAAGQVNQATKPWLPKVAGWCLVIILYNPIAGTIYAVGFVMVGAGTDIATVLTGMTILCLAVVSMPTMMRFFDWGGQRLTGGGGSGGGAAAVGAAAAVLGGGGAMGMSRYMDQTGPAGRPNRETNVGAQPVSSAHNGDGPGDQPAGGAAAGQPGMGPGGDGPPRPGAGGVAPASAPAGAGAGSGAAASGAGGAAAGGAGPAGAAIVAAQGAKDGVSNAMTGGAPSSGGGGDD